MEIISSQFHGRFAETHVSIEALGAIFALAMTLTVPRTIWLVHDACDVHVYDDGVFLAMGKGAVKDTERGVREIASKAGLNVAWIRIKDIVVRVPFDLQEKDYDKFASMFSMKRLSSEYHADELVRNDLQSFIPCIRSGHLVERGKDEEEVKRKVQDWEDKLLSFQMARKARIR